MSEVPASLIAEESIGVMGKQTVSVNNYVQQGCAIRMVGNQRGERMVIVPRCRGYMQNVPGFFMFHHRHLYLLESDRVPKFYNLEACIFGV